MAGFPGTSFLKPVRLMDDRRGLVKAAEVLINPEVDLLLHSPPETPTSCTKPSLSMARAGILLQRYRHAGHWHLRSVHSDCDSASSTISTVVMEPSYSPYGASSRTLATATSRFFENAPGKKLEASDKKRIVENIFEMK